MENEALTFAIDYLSNVNKFDNTAIPYNFDTMRALMNISMPYNFSDEYYKAQDKIIKDYYKGVDIIDALSLPFVRDNIVLWKGDITHIKADAITNACNSALLGCFQMLHNCIDNAIHSFAGLQMRRDLIGIMEHQGHLEPNGQAKITKGYNLPSKYVIHTVGPIVKDIITIDNQRDLSNCYLSSLKLAEENSVKSLVFCSISTGLYGYPITEASKVAISSVKEYFCSHKSNIERVVFNVFSKGDYDVYYKTITASY